MAKEELKQMINRVTIQGTLMDNNIEIKVNVVIDNTFLFVRKFY